MSARRPVAQSDTGCLLLTEGSMNWQMTGLESHLCQTQAAYCWLRVLCTDRWPGWSHSSARHRLLTVDWGFYVLTDDRVGVTALPDTGCLLLTEGSMYWQMTGLESHLCQTQAAYCWLRVLWTDRWPGWSHTSVRHRLLTVDWGFYVLTDDRVGVTPLSDTGCLLLTEGSMNWQMIGLESDTGCLLLTEDSMYWQMIRFEYHLTSPNIDLMEDHSSCDCREKNNIALTHYS